MKSGRLLKISGVVVVVGAVAAYGTRDAVGGDGCCSAKAASGCSSAAQCPSRPVGCEKAGQCPSKSAGAVSILNDAISALRGGRPEVALERLAAARELIVQDTRGSGSAAKSAVVNEYCPVTGNSIDPGHVPVGLVREFRGQKIGFCIAASLELWDGLSEAEKETLVLDVTLPEHG